MKYATSCSCETLVVISTTLEYNMGIIILALILIIVPIFYILNNSKLSTTKKALIIIAIVLFLLVCILYIFITGWERGRNPKQPESEKIEQNNNK
ncbi:hypothetical protein [Flavobacterium koreense]